MEAQVSGDGFIHVPGRQWRCCHGRGGLSDHKAEGDGATPTGLLTLRRVLFPRRPWPGPAHHRAHGTDRPQRRLVRRPVRRTLQPRRPPALPPATTRNCGGGTPSYDIVGVLGWNDAPVVRFMGSAIFLHVARPDYTPTEGCIALSSPDLRALLAAGLSAVRTGPATPRG